MSPLRVVIADDEPLARDGLRRFITQQHDTIIVAECADGAQTVDAIRAHQPDLVFLDVQMPRLDGFGVIAAVGAHQMPSVVFVTAYDEYACRAFEVSAVDYLLKPVDESRLRDAFDRAVRATDRATLSELRDALAQMTQRLAAPERSEMPAAHAAAIERLAVRVGDRIEFLEVRNIDWIESEGNYVRMHAAGRSHLIRQTLDAFHSQVGTSAFVRVRRSVLVRTRAIRACEPFVKGSYVLILHDGTRLTSSRYFRSNLRSALSETL